MWDLEFLVRFRKFLVSPAALDSGPTGGGKHPVTGIFIGFWVFQNPVEGRRPAERERWERWRGWKRVIWGRNEEKQKKITFYTRQKRRHFGVRILAKIRVFSRGSNWPSRTRLEPQAGHTHHICQEPVTSPVTSLVTSASDPNQIRFQTQIRLSTRWRRQWCHHHFDLHWARLDRDWSTFDCRWPALTLWSFFPYFIHFLFPFSSYTFRIFILNCYLLMCFVYMKIIEKI